MKRRLARYTWHSKFLSELLAQLRVHVGLTLKELSERAGISPHTIGSCERYCGNISIEKTFRFIEGLGFDHLAVSYEVGQRLQLAGKSPVSRKLQRPGIFFKWFYEHGALDRHEINRQLRVMRKLRKAATKRSSRGNGDRLQLAAPPNRVPSPSEARDPGRQTPRPRQVKHRKSLDNRRDEL